MQSARSGGTIRKPSKLKPNPYSGTSAKVKAGKRSEFPKSLSGKGVDRNAALMNFMDRVQSVPAKRNNYADLKNSGSLGRKKAARAVQTSAKAQEYIYSRIRGY